MNCILCHDGGDQKTVKRLLELLRGIKAESGECVPGGNGEGLEPIIERLSHTCCLILYLSRPGVPSWVYFIAGLAAGLNIPLLLFGRAPEEFGPLLSKCLTAVKTEIELSGYIHEKLPETLSREARNRAKYELLEKGIPFNEESLANCVIGGNREAVNLFLEAGISPNTADSFGVPLLNLAARMGHRNIAKILLKAGAEVNRQAGDRLSTALFDAVAGRHYGMVKDLLARNADVNLKSRDGQSALIIAVGINDETSVELLLKAGANADEPDSLGVSGRKYADLFKKPVMVSLFNAYAPRKNQE
jgi:hypothetical protein